MMGVTQARSPIPTAHAPSRRVDASSTKYAMHALRIAHQGNELLATGRISLPVAEPARSRLMARSISFWSAPTSARGPRLDDVSTGGPYWSGHGGARPELALETERKD